MAAAGSMEEGAGSSRLPHPPTGRENQTTAEVRLHVEEGVGPAVGGAAAGVGRRGWAPTRG